MPAIISAVVIQHAIWLDVRFTLSCRDVEELLAERGLEVSYETIRRWVLQFGPEIARHLYPWRAVGSEGEVLDILVQRRRDQAAAGRLMRTLLRTQGLAPAEIAMGKLRSYGAAFAEPGLAVRHEQGPRRSNRAEVSSQPVRRRERKMQRFASPGSAQRLVSVHAAVDNIFNLQCHLNSRRTPRPFRAQRRKGGRPQPRRASRRPAPSQICAPAEFPRQSRLLASSVAPAKSEELRNQDTSGRTCFGSTARRR